MSAVIHINGWPGSGKLTIARQLAPLLDARLIEPGVILGPANALAERGERLHASLRLAVRKSVLDHAARLPSTRSVIFIDTYSETPDDKASFADYGKLADKRGVRLIPILLTIDAEENVRRLTADGRADQNKLTNPQRLADLRGRYALLRGKNAIELDVTELSPEAAARQLTSLIRSRLNPT
ncbi:MAG: hypothetical protein JWM33_3511 [Caulobacteraceae bacterium]|nr:hypothetical protein [Caulobacteraceae bacterium]